MRGCFRKMQLQLGNGTMKRFFADRGPTRKDFTDPGFQEQGYINSGWFGSTGPERLSLVEKDFTHTPIYTDDHSYEIRLKKERRKKTGDARRAYEEDQAAEQDEGEAKGKKELKRSAKELPVIDFLATPKRRAAMRILHEKGVRSRVIKDYSSFGYEGSGLDEYTRWLEEKKKEK